MLRMRTWRSWGILAAGIAMGLSIGLALAAGLALGGRSDATTTAGLPPFGDLQLRAMASHGSDTFAIATGPVDEEVEGLFTLDFLTGDLQCFVINPRNGAVGGWFKTNVAKELPPEGSKKPSYLISTGRIQVQGAAGNQRPAASICYVVDANTGNVGAYSFPWSRAAMTQGAAQATEMRTIGKWKSRSVNLRD